MNEKKRVLEYVNFIRRFYQGRPPLKKLPRGVMGEPEMCPIAVALNGEREVSVNGELIMLGDVQIPLPDLISDFVTEFDSGGYPELEELESADD